MGSIAGQDCAPISWMFGAAGCTKDMVLAGSLLLVLLEMPAGVEVVVTGGVLTCTVDTGTLNVASVMSGFCWTGEVAVCAWFCFSRFLHLARRFWNQTYKHIVVNHNETYFSRVELPN